MAQARRQARASPMQRERCPRQSLITAGNAWVNDLFLSVGYDLRRRAPLQNEVSAGFDFYDTGHEPIAALWHRLDVLHLTGRFAKRFSQKRDVTVEAVLFDHRIGPDRSHHLLFVNQPP